MSAVKIIRKLNSKGITPVNVIYQRSCPTPSGHATGWDIELKESDTDLLWNLGFNKIESRYMEFDDLRQVLDFIDSMPVIGGDS